MALLALGLCLKAGSDPLGSDAALARKEPGLTALTEQRVYVPYKHLKEVLDKKEKGIFIPHSDFLKLWEELTRKPPEEPLLPPIDAAIVHAAYRGSVQDQMAQFHAEFTISALREKWAKLFLHFEEVAITFVSLNGRAPLLKPAPQGLELVLPEKGTYVLEMDFCAKVQTVPGKRFIRFRVPAAPLARMQMTIPGKELDVKIQPMLSEKSRVVDGNTEFSAFLSPKGEVHVSWLAKSMEEKEAKGLLFSKLYSKLNVKESVYTFNTDISLSVMQAKTGTFRVKIPERLSLVSVEGKNIKDWEMGDDRILRVDLYEKVEGNYRLSIQTEQYREVDEKTFRFPQLEVMGAEREEGIIAIYADPSLRVQVEKKDRVTQLDPAEFRDKESGAGLVSVFKYHRRPYLIQLAVFKIEPRITAHQEILVAFGETTIDYHSEVHFTVRDAGVFHFRFMLPDGFRVVETGSEETVDTFSVSEEKGDRVLEVLLRNKAFGKYVLPIRLEADRKDENISLSLPKMRCMGVEKEDGVIAISLRKNLKLSTGQIKHLRPVSLKELAGVGMADADENQVLAAGYRYSTTDYTCTLNIEKRKTKIIATVERNIDLQEAVLKVRDVIRYQILYAPVDRFLFEMPAAMGKDAVITGENIKEKRFVRNEKGDKGVWQIVLHAPQLNTCVLRVSLEKKIDEIKTGEERAIHVPFLRILDVFNESGFLSVGKAPELQVDALGENLEAIDAKKLPSSMNRAQSVLAFRYLAHPYALTINATKHEYEEVLDAIVNEAHFDIVVSKEGIAKTEGVLRIQNTNRQSLELQMPEGTENIYAVFISGKKASISRGRIARSKIIMLGGNVTSGREFTLRILYQSRLREAFGLFGSVRIDSAEVMEIPTSKITWRLYLPYPYSYVYMKGSMDPLQPRYAGRQSINPSIASQKVSPRSQIALNEKQILQRSDEKALYGFDMDLVREGRLYRLSKLDRNAFVDAWYVKRSILFPVSIVLMALVTLVFSLVASIWPVNRILFFVISLVIALLLRISLPQGFKYLALLVFLGIALAGLILAGVDVYRRLQLRKGKAEKPDGGSQEHA
jgi:hypothetical protein